MSEEEWRKIEKYLYEVSNHGNVRNAKKLVMRPSTHYKGHKFIYLYNEQGRKKFFVHRLVAVAFIPNPEMKLLVNHIDENKANNHLSNLEWMTEGENTRYYWARKGVVMNPNNEEF